MGDLPEEGDGNRHICPPIRSSINSKNKQYLQASKNRLEEVSTHDSVIVILSYLMADNQDIFLSFKFHDYGF